MGEVYRARDSKLGRDVALKVLPADMASSPERLKRFRREARALAALDHPGIVTVHSVEEAGGIHFLTMQLVEGRSLDRVIAEGRLSSPRIATIARDLVEALAAAHEKGIVHRDLKPANVLVGVGDRVKICDFGLAKIAEPEPTLASDAEAPTALQTQDGVIMGTLPYMAPEQVAGRDIDHRSDIFSLGIMLHEMATGKRPFQGRSTVELASAILRDDPAPIDTVRSDLPEALRGFISRCLEKNPEDRHPTLTGVAAGLLAGEGAAGSGSNADDTPTLALATSPLESEPPATARGAASPRQRREEGFWIAVLPFEVRGAESGLETLADGLGEDLVTGLSRFPYLRVLARGSADPSVVRDGDVREVGRDLGARYILEGKIRQAGAALRVAVQLVDTDTGANLWAETFDRAYEPSAIFELQDELVPRIVSTVADWYGILPHAMSEAVRSKTEADLSAYEAVLRAFGYFERVTPEEHAAVRPILERAVVQAPGDALAWAMLSMIYGEEHRFGFPAEPDPLDRSLDAARRAAAAAPSSHLSQLALAQAHYFRRELDSFRHAADRSIALQPMDGATIQYLAHLIAFSGDWQRGLELGESSRRLNPHHPAWYWALPLLHAYRSRDRSALRELIPRAVMPGQSYSMALTTACYVRLGDREAVARSVRELSTLDPKAGDTILDQFAKWYEPELVEQLGRDLREAGLALPSTEKRETAARSIAVLPFNDLSPDRDQEYLCEGMAEEIINALTRLPDVRVIARASAFRLRDEPDLCEVGRALGVGTLLEGSVRKAGNRLRITAQLVDVADQSHLWSERFDREMDDVFAIQDEISAAIVERLDLNLRGDDPQPPPDRDVDAYRALLEARHFFSQFTPGAAERALGSLERALRIEPEFPDALSLHALHHVMMGYMFEEPRKHLPRARAMAEKALKLDPRHGEAQATLALVATWLDRAWQHGETLFGRAREMTPGSARVHELHGLITLLGRDRLDESLAALDRALELDPLSALYVGNRGRVLTCSRRFEEAEMACRRGLELDPGQLLVQVELMYALTFQGRPDEAASIGRRLLETHGAVNATLTALVVALAQGGRFDEAQQVLDEVENSGSDAYRSPLTRGLLLASQADMNSAFVALESAAEARDPLLMYLDVHPIFDPLRAEPGYAQLRRQLNLGDG